MQICFLTDSPYVIGGVERVLSVVASELSKIHDVTIVCTKDIEPNNIYNMSEAVKVEVIEGLKDKKINYFFRKILRRLNLYHEFKSYKILKAIYYPKAESRRIINTIKDRFDVVIGVRDFYSLQLAIIARDIHVKKCLGWFHNSYKAYFETPMYYSWHKKALFDKFMENLDTCVVLTKKDEKLFKKNLGDHFTHIYNPLTCSPQTKASNKDIDILFLGRLDKLQKGLDYLLDIIQICIKQKTDISCHIVGTGPDEVYLIEEIKKRKLEKQVVFEGASTDVSKYYSRAKVLVNTSRWEGFGLVVTEAMANGIPVVSFKTEGPSEIIENKRSGVLIDCYDTSNFASEIVNLINDDKIRIAMGKNALTRSLTFSPQNTIKCWNQILV